MEVNRNKLLPFVFERIGRQWGKFKGEPGKNTYEIDLAAINSSTKQILLAECKWNKQKIGSDVITSLLNKAKYVNWYSRERREYFAVFSRSGFTSGAQSLAKERGVLLFDMEDIGRVIN
jgi:AAA+ ATPase superfamily predicted ATPase